MENHLLAQIVEWDKIEETCDGYIQVTGARFKKDFGPWLKCQYVHSLALSYEGSELVEYDSQGERIRVCKLKLISE